MMSACDLPPSTSSYLEKLSDEFVSTSVKKKTTARKKKLQNSTIVATPSFLCRSCNGVITDRFMFQVDDNHYHEDCVQCFQCRKILNLERSCFVKNGDIYCKQDYLGLFGPKCAKCGRNISPTDWVRRARECIYHLACFACDTCKRQLSTGEEFMLNSSDSESRLLCKTHCAEPGDGCSVRMKDDNSDSSSCSTGKAKTKRMRTTFTDEQLQVLQASFNLDSNPDGQDLERIAQMTGLSKRVTQVWFQNSRARQKKHQQQSQRKVHARQAGNPLSSSETRAGHNLVNLQLGSVNSPTQNSSDDIPDDDYSTSSFL